MSYAAAILAGYNDFDSARVDDESYWAYLEGCVYTNIRVALAVGFSYVIFFLLDATYTLDYGGKYTRRHDARAVPVESRRGELCAPYPETEGPCRLRPISFSLRAILLRSYVFPVDPDFRCQSIVSTFMFNEG